MGNFEIFARGWARRAAVLSSVVLTVARVSAQGVSPRSAEAVRDTLPPYEIPTAWPHAEAAFPDGPLPIPYPRGATSTPLFGPAKIAPVESLDVTGANLSNHNTLSPPRFTAPEIRLPCPLVAVGDPSARNPRMITRNGGYMPLLARGDYALGMTGSHRGYPSMGFSNSFAVGQSWAVADGVTLHGGVYASDNLYRMNRFKDFGVSGSVRVEVTDGITLSGYGSYSVYNSAGGQRPVPPMMFPENRYGGNIQVKITDKFGLQGGVERGFNMFTRRWETSYYVLPVFY